MAQSNSSCSQNITIFKFSLKAFIHQKALGFEFINAYQSNLNKTHSAHYEKSNFKYPCSCLV